MSKRGGNAARDSQRLLDRERRNWEGLADLDPLWAILSIRRRKFGRWDNEAFFAEGDRDVEYFVSRFRALARPRSWGAVLDFGCGVGRLAPSLSSHFDSYCGVDLSAEMVKQASDAHRDRPNCRFVVNRDATLAQFDDQSFDLVFSLRVLQHLTDRSVIHGYLQSLFRLVRPGGLLVFQLPDHIPRAEKLIYDTRRRLFIGLGRLGVPQRLMFRRMSLHPMTMNFVPEDSVVATLQEQGAQLLSIEPGKQGIAIRDRTYYATR